MSPSKPTEITPELVAAHGLTPDEYTRIVKLAWRKGDGAETAKLELVGSELVKRAAERAARKEERLKQLREQQGGEENE